jgi:hypothetical protein
MKTQLSFMALPVCLALALCAPLSAKSPESVQERVAAQNVLFDEYYETELKTHPEMATAYGDYRYNDQLNASAIGPFSRA